MIQSADFLNAVQKWASVAKFAAALDMSDEDKHSLIGFSELVDVCDLVQTLAGENLGDSFRHATCDPFGVSQGFSISNIKNAAMREGKKAKLHWVRVGHTWAADISETEAVSEAQ